MDEIDVSQHTLASSVFESVTEKAMDEATTFFFNTPVHELPLQEKFEGAGVYALYYTGAFPPYQAIKELNKHGRFTQPIYVGKAVPTGSRRGMTGKHRTQLYARIAEHVRSINQGDGLSTQDFMCQFMVMSGTDADYIIPFESALIRRTTPLWNSVVDGFGNHAPGRGRNNQAPSEWDTLHPGRPWAMRLTGVPPEIETIKKKIANHLHR